MLNGSLLDPRDYQSGSKKLLANTCKNPFECLSDPKDIHSAYVENPFVGSWNPSGNLIFYFFQNMACYIFLGSSYQGLFNDILYFEFGEKLSELYSNEGFKSTYFI